ncbi:MAG: dTMP kinase [Labrys sp. (in: a-proteobacteria)]
MQRGRFITFEGGEGAGKSTQIRRLSERLRAIGIDPVVTREPGGSPGAEALRELLLGGAAKPFGPVAEAALFYAARDDHLEETIRPALASGRWVVCDRFSDSTRAYQGAAGGVDDTVLRALDRIVVAKTRPDLTIILDVPPEEGLKRAQARGLPTDRFEAEGLAFHERLREKFLAIAAREPDRCVVIDGTANVDAVSDAVWQATSDRLLTAVGEQR